jgi:ankyrin repeat protein
MKFIKHLILVLCILLNFNSIFAAEQKLTKEEEEKIEGIKKYFPNLIEKPDEMSSIEMSSGLALRRFTPLIFCIKKYQANPEKADYYYTIIEILIKRLGANVNLEDNSGSGSPLRTAINSADSKIVKFLLKNGADPLLKSAGHQPLYWAEQRDSQDIIKLVQEAAKKKKLEEEEAEEQEWENASEEVEKERIERKITEEKAEAEQKARKAKEIKNLKEEVAKLKTNPEAFEKWKEQNPKQWAEIKAEEEKQRMEKIWEEYKNKHPKEAEAALPIEVEQTTAAAALKEGLRQRRHSISGEEAKPKEEEKAAQEAAGLEAERKAKEAAELERKREEAAKKKKLEEEKAAQKATRLEAEREAKEAAMAAEKKRKEEAQAKAETERKKLQAKEAARKKKLEEEKEKAAQEEATLEAERKVKEVVPTEKEDLGNLIPGDNLTQIAEYLKLSPEKVIALIINNPDVVINNQGQTLLIFAAINNLYDLAKWLVDNGANIKYRDKTKKTALGRAYDRRIKQHDNEPMIATLEKKTREMSIARRNKQ